MNPFMAFCLYVAARVFIQFLKKIPNNFEIRASLDLLLTAMRVLQRKNPLTESFLIQLYLDIEGSGLDIAFHHPDYSSIAKERAVSSYCHTVEYASPESFAHDTTEQLRVPTQFRSQYFYEYWLLPGHPHLRNGGRFEIARRHALSRMAESIQGAAHHSPRLPSPNTICLPQQH